MADITVRLKDYAMLEVDVEPGIAAELSDHFSFYVPGYKFMPAYKNKVWDGKIKLFNRISGEISAGLMTYLQDFAAARSYTLAVQESPLHGSPLDKNIVPSLISWLHKCENLPFEPRSSQLEALQVALEKSRAILLSPTGSGKSYIIYLLILYYISMISKDQPILIIVPTTSLVEQMYADFQDYGMNVDKHCHRIYSGKDKNVNKRVIISTWQSIYKFPPAWFKRFGMVIGDECHGFKSKSLSSIMNKATEAKYRFGLTGTLDGTQTHKLVLEGLFGPVYQVTTTKDLQDDGTLAPLKINMVMLQYPEDVRKNFGQREYQDEIKYIIEHEGRNKFIRNLALSLSGNSLVLYNRVDGHGVPLFNMIRDKAADGRKVFFVSGQVDVDDREAIRKIVETQKDAIIVASLGTFSTGINIRNLHNIVFASPSKSQIKVLQSIGRGLRQSDDRRTTTLYDISDNLCWKKRVNFAMRHAGERLKIYENQQFEHVLVKVDIK